MTKPHFTTQQGRTRRNLWIAVLGLFALLASACSSEPTQTATWPLPTLVPEAPADSADYGDAAATGTTDAGATPENTGVIGETEVAGTAYASTSQHGQTLDQWTASQAAPSSADLAEQAPSEGVATIAWNDLIPDGQSSQDLYERFEDRLLEVEFGSEEATLLYQEMEAEFDTEAVNEELEGQAIWLAGFVAPLTFQDERVTEFLLVPNFGACIHVPAPPPNQTIMVTLEGGEGLTVEEAWGAVWVEGTLTLVSAETELAPASYTITSASTGVYKPT